MDLSQKPDEDRTPHQPERDYDSDSMVPVSQAREYPPQIVARRNKDYRYKAQQRINRGIMMMFAPVQPPYED
jgi:hypothetical protein